MFFIYDSVWNSLIRYCSHWCNLLNHGIKTVTTAGRGHPKLLSRMYQNHLELGNLQPCEAKLLFQWTNSATFLTRNKESYVNYQLLCFILWLAILYLNIRHNENYFLSRYAREAFAQMCSAKEFCLHRRQTSRLLDVRMRKLNK